VYRKSSGRNSTICASKNEAVFRGVQTLLEVLCLRVLQKSSRRNSTIYVSKNEAVCCVAQTHFESSLPARFTEKVLGAMPRFMCSKMKRWL